MRNVSFVLMTMLMVNCWLAQGDLPNWTDAQLRALPYTVVNPKSCVSETETELDVCWVEGVDDVLQQEGQSPCWGVNPGGTNLCINPDKNRRVREYVPWAGPGYGQGTWLEIDDEGCQDPGGAMGPLTADWVFSPMSQINPKIAAPNAPGSKKAKTIEDNICKISTYCDCISTYWGFGDNICIAVPFQTYRLRTYSWWEHGNCDEIE